MTLDNRRHDRTPARSLGDGEDFEILLAIEAGRVAALLTAMPLLLA